LGDCEDIGFLGFRIKQGSSLQTNERIGYKPSCFPRNNQFFWEVLKITQYSSTIEQTINQKNGYACKIFRLFSF
jgi:hypothetical protein